MMSDGQLKSLTVVAAKLRADEAPLKAAGDPKGLGVGAAALLVEMAGAEIERLRAAHQPLIEALREMIKVYEFHFYEDAPALVQARAALALAEQQKVEDGK